MSHCAKDSKKALHTSVLLLSQLENHFPLPNILVEALEATIRLSDSRFAFLIHNYSGSLITEFAAHIPENQADKEYLKHHAEDILSCLIPQMRLTSPLFANSSTAVKEALDNTMAWRLFQRLMLIPLNSITGDKKGILALFGKSDAYTESDILVIEPLLSLCISLLTLDEQQPEEKRELIKGDSSARYAAPLIEYDYQFKHDKKPKFITDSQGRIIHCNTAAENAFALPSEVLSGTYISHLIPKLELNHRSEATTAESVQELKALSKTGKMFSVQVSYSPFMQNSELLFSVQVRENLSDADSKTERHEKAFRIQKQQRTTLEVARLATQEEAPFEHLVRDICQLAAATLKVPRSGIWLCDEETPVFRNIVQTDLTQRDYCESSPLILNSNSTFVRQLEQVRVLSMVNLNAPIPNTSFLSHEYIQRNQTATVICAAFIKNSKLIGFLMIEDTTHTLWQEDQYNFIREIANYLHILVLNEHRLKIQNDLARQEQQFRLLFFDSPLAMMAFDKETFQFVAVNHTATEVFGYNLDEMLHKGIYDLIPVKEVMDIHTLVSSHNESGKYHVLESRMQKRSGEMVDVEIHSHSINLSSRASILMVIHDITERKQIESSLRRTQKMEAVGQLVGGIAHDFNNITNIIKGHAELLEMKLAGNEKTAKHINAIHKAANRTTSLTKKLMQFSRQQQINSEVCNIGDILWELTELVTKSLTGNIEVVMDIAADLSPVLIDRGDFEDVMINLAINARDAMDGHGTLTIRAINTYLDKDSPLMIRDRKPGHYTRVSVGDTGSGIPKELQEKIFDPFFTTKEKGKGTGLGLSMVYGFAKRSGGFMELKTKEGHGTTFFLWLPHSDEKPSKSNLTASQEPAIVVSPGHTALVVDDEEDIRSSLSEMLEAIGFAVKQAESAAHAKEIIQNQSKPFSLVLSDIVMPGEENGVNLAQWIKETSQNTHVILASGYSENISLTEARNLSCELLKKPFGRQDILHILSQWQWR